jgi:D-proline reductase (dithiol) PrdB
MTETHELSLSLRAFLKTYPWRRIDPVPLAKITKPIRECRVAVISSAGFVVPGDEPFSDSVRGGDSSFRVIPKDTDLQALEDHHRSDSYSHDGVAADRNMGLPIDRLNEFAADGIIGEVAPRHISVMGSITAPRRFIRQTLPAVADILIEDRVDIALMVPV